MDIENILAAMTPEIYQKLLYACETGKWADGVALTPEQREQAMQAVMLYQSRNNHDADHMTVATDGEIRFKSKRELKAEWSGEELIQVRQK
uniref:YeaC family protein n=1 Tax=Thaumasiovibrio occultus TaxID=1891184 RepID=UPI000B35EF0E|nr:DUF1315 family protein [Thaumasiovibrio occultus]